MAAFLRFYRLPLLPPGLNFDEAGNGVAALDILEGRPQLWWRIGGGKEPGWPYLVAAGVTMLGNIPLALRLPAAMAGLLTVAAVYPLMLRLFGRLWPPDQARLAALLTMLGLALSAWHLHFSRLGFRAILLPLFSTLAFYFFWRGLPGGRQPARPQPEKEAIRPARPQNRLPETPGSPAPPFRPPSSTLRLHLILAALFTALAVYAYLAGRLLPFVPLLFILLAWLISKARSLFSALKTRFSPPARPVPPPPLPVVNYRLPFIIYFLALSLFLLPLGVYFLLNPADFIARSETVSLFNAGQNQGDLFGTAWRTLTLTLGTFFGLSGDPNPLVNLPGRPALPLFLAPFFGLGFVVALYHTLHPAPPRARRRSAVTNYQLPVTDAPYLFLLCWWTLMLLPALLAPEGAPHHLRLLGAIIPTYAFVAVGFVVAVSRLTRLFASALRPSLAPIFASLLPAGCYILLAFQTCTAYFLYWPGSTDFTLPFDLYAVRLADDITAAPPATGYVLPMDLRAGREARHYTLDYLLWPADAAAYTYVPVDERHAETLLAAAATGKTALRIVRWRRDKHHEADAKEIVTYLMTMNGEQVNQERFPVYDVDTYDLLVDQGWNCPPDTAPEKSAACPPAASGRFTLPPITHPINAVFDGLLRLEAAFVPASISAGEPLPVALTVAPLAPVTVDYKASVRLIGPDGARVAQKDRLLRHNFHQGTSLWPPEAVNEYYLLPVPGETPPGDYTVVVVVYDPESGAPLTVEGVVELPVGSVRIEEVVKD